MATSKSPPSLWDQVRARLDGDLLADLGLQLPSRFPTDLVEHEIEVLLEDGPSFAFVAWKASPRRPVFFLTDDGSCDVVAATRDELAALLLYAGADPHHRSGAKTARASLSREVRGRLDSVRDDLGLSADPALYATLRKRAKDLLGDVNLYAPATPRVIPDGPRLFAPDRGTKPAAKGASVAEKVTTRSTQPSLSIDRVADDPAQTRFSSSSAPRSAFKKVVWRTSATPFTGSGGYNLGATVKGGSAYAWGGNWVASFDLASGALRWKRRLPEKPRVGIGSRNGVSAAREGVRRLHIAQVRAKMPFVHRHWTGGPR